MDNFPPEVQHILAPAFGILSATQTTQMADRLMEMHGFSKLYISALPTPLTPPASPLLQLEIELGSLADDTASLQKPTVSPSPRRQPKPSTPHVQSSHSARSETAATCWYHTTFGVKARHCITPCSFTSKQSKRVNPVSPKVSAVNLPDSSNPGRTFYVHDTRSGRRFLVDTGAHLSVIPPTPTDRRCTNPRLFLQAVNTLPITTFGTCSLSLNIGLRRLFPWVFVVVDIPCAILGADFLTAFDRLVDWCQSRLHDKTTILTVRGISSSDASRQLAVLDPEPENLFRQLLAQYPGLTRSNFNASIPPHDVVHHIRTFGPPELSRLRRLLYGLVENRNGGYTLGKNAIAASTNVRQTVSWYDSTSVLKDSAIESRKSIRKIEKSIAYPWMEKSTTWIHKTKHVASSETSSLLSPESGNRELQED
ncbi:hypothetical protein SprV_0301213700 [Sparganum proliferum]